MRPAVIAGFEQWVHAEAPAERLAALRILIGGFVTIYVAINIGEVRRLGGQDVAAFEPVGAARLLAEPLASSALWAWWLVAVVLGVLFCLGLAHRVVGPMFALAVFGWASYRSSWGQMLHFEHLFTLHVMVLALAPAADTWSLRLRSSPRRPSSSDVRYGWPIRLLAIATVTTYALSGIAKLRLTGIAWFGTDILWNHIAYSANRIQLVGGPTPPLAGWVLDRPWLVSPMALGAAFVELGAPLALVSRRWRFVWIPAALAFHAATAATMFVFFGYRGLGIGLLPVLFVPSFGRRPEGGTTR